MNCEVCGSKLTAPPGRIEIDGAFLSVCPNCARRGRPVVQRPVGRPTTLWKTRRPVLMEPDLEIDPDYGALVRHGREKLGISQEDLGKKMNLKPSVVSLIETQKMKPDFQLARKLMHELKIDLLVSAEEFESSVGR